MDFQHAQVDSRPEGSSWQKCTRPGCRRKATVVVVREHAGHTYRCSEHTAHHEIVDAVEAGRGKGIARKRADAYGGYSGWRRWMVGDRLEG